MSARDWTSTRFTERFGCRYPIVQGPMGGGASTPELVAAVSNAGGLGSLGCYHLEPAAILSAAAVEEAEVLEESGVDLVVASGFEAGGHRGSLLRPAEQSLTGTFSLVPQVASAVRIPAPDHGPGERRHRGRGDRRALR